MPIRTIVVALDPAVELETLLDQALKIARRMEGHLEVLLLQPDLSELAAAYPALARMCPIEKIRIDSEDVARTMAARFEAWRERRDVPARIVDRMLGSTYATWTACEGSPIIGLLRRARLADLVVMMKPDGHGGLGDVLVEAAMFDSGRPLLLVPGPSDIPLLERVAVAWNSSLPAVRALSAAMPFLHEAEHVEILSLAAPHPREADPCMISGEDVVEALSWQGARASVGHVALQPDEGPGAALLREATALGVSLLAMGAFTHSRVRGAGLGGVTGYMLQHAEIPLLMAH
ncbi:universal stress protein [Lichenicola sp.]|uniref:universal stress protein n=1 Tax=Lichenicola sp. TaxID=2804529 RepID=UPI003B00F4A2